MPRAQTRRPSKALEPVPVALIRALVEIARRLDAPSSLIDPLAAILDDGTHGEPGTEARVYAVGRDLEEQFWEQAAKEPMLRGLAIEGPLAAPPHAFGSLELAASTAETVKHALHTLGQFSAVLHGESIFGTAERSDGSIALIYDSHHARGTAGAELAAEVALSAVVTLLRRHTGDERLAPRELHLRGQPIAPASALEGALGCVVYTDAASDRLELAPDVAALPLRTSVPALHTIAIRLCRLERAALLGERTAASVRWAVREVVTQRVPLLEAVAEILHTRPRTMQARLTAEGVSFRGLVDEARRVTVDRLLIGGASPREIQNELGYADAASLRRACRRWWKMGPTSRARALRVTPSTK